MRKIVTGAVVVALAVSCLGVAEAKKPKKKKKLPVAVETTLHFHGAEALGEAESDPAVNPVYLPMDPLAPEGSTIKSKQITSGFVTPNTQCAGSQLFPVWTGRVAGQIVGNAKVTLNTLSSPGGKVDVRIWPDINGLACTSTAAGTTDYPPPAAEKTIDLPVGPGTTEVDLGPVNFPAAALLMIQISPTAGPDVGPQGTVTPFFGRVLYDTPEYDSSITFSCIPATGTSCTP